MRDLRTVNMISGQKIESDKVIKRIGDISYRNIGSMLKMLFDEGKALIMGSGLRVEPSSSMTVNIPKGLFFQRISSGDIIPVIQNDDQTVTLDAASGVARTDIIEAQIQASTNKDDISQVATASGGAEILVLNTAIKRDIKYHLAVQKQTGTTTATPGTAGELVGTVDVSSPINISTTYLINLADKEDGSFQEIDCRGADPTATSRAEIIGIINTAVGRTMASVDGNFIKLSGSGTGETSVFEIKPPTSDSEKDGLEAIFGVSIGGVYDYIYRGTNEWVKLAEIDIDVATATVTEDLIRNIDQKETWASDAENILLLENIYDEIQGINSGWIKANEKWTYASASTFTVASNYAAKYDIGDKIKLTQTTVKYFYVISKSAGSPGITIITISGGTDYTLANTEITDKYFSKECNPNGFPHWFNYTPGLRASSGTITSLTQDKGKFAINGRLLSFFISSAINNNGTGSVGLVVDLPVPPITVIGYQHVFGTRLVFPGTSVYNITGQISTGTIDIIKDDYATYPGGNSVWISIAGSCEI